MSLGDARSDQYAVVDALPTHCVWYVSCLEKRLCLVDYCTCFFLVEQVFSPNIDLLCLPVYIVSLVKEKVWMTSANLNAQACDQPSGYPLFGMHDEESSGK